MMVVFAGQPANSRTTAVLARASSTIEGTISHRVRLGRLVRQNHCNNMSKSGGGGSSKGGSKKGGARGSGSVAIKSKTIKNKTKYVM